MITNDIETKLSAARTRLIIDKPFLGALVLRLPMEEADKQWCKTSATDAKTFYYNPEYINALSLEETQFVLAHEALHCALSHFARRQHRVKHRWDLACDYAINPLLVKDGLKPPPNALTMREYEGMTAEEIYPLIDEHDYQQPMDEHVYDESDSEGQNPSGNMPPDKESQKPKDQPKDGDKQQPKQEQGKSSNQQHKDPQQQQGKGQGNQGEPDSQQQGAPQPPPLSHQERDDLSIQWKNRMAGAAQQALQAGKLDGEMARMVDFLLQPELPWRNLLAHYMTSIARDDYSYTRPSSRRGDPAIYPSLRSAQIDIVIALDTSGSISNGEIQEFISEVDAIKGQLRARITLHACDSELAKDGPWVYESWEEFFRPRNFSGGGGTSFDPVFEWAERLDKRPDLLVYFTDGEATFPAAVPDFPVIWLIKGKIKVPWGQRVQLN